MLHAWKHFSNILNGLDLTWITNNLCRAEITEFERVVGESIDQFGYLYIDDIGMFPEKENDNHVLIRFNKPIHVVRFGTYEDLMESEEKEVMENL